jgi:hypothetical protein
VLPGISIPASNPLPPRDKIVRVTRAGEPITVSVISTSNFRLVSDFEFREMTSKLMDGHKKAQKTSRLSPPCAFCASLRLVLQLPLMFRICCPGFE